MKRARIAIAGLLLLVLAQPSFAQFGPNGQKKNVKQMVERQVKSQKTTLTTQMNARIDEIVRVCDLEGIQRKKLQIAAKGAVGKSLEYYAKYMESVYNRQFNRNIQRRVAKANPARKGKKKEGDKGKKLTDAEKKANAAKKKAKQKAENAKRAVARRAAMRILPYKRPIPWQEKIWLKAITKTLNAEQNEAFTEHLNLRKAFNRRNGVSTYVSQMDQALFLSEHQRNSLMKLVDDTFGKAMEDTPTNQIYAMRGWVGMGANGRTRQIKLLPQPKIRRILSDPQLAIWQGQLRRFGAFGRAAGGFGIAPPRAVRAARPARAVRKRPAAKKKAAKKPVKKPVKKTKKK